MKKNNSNKKKKASKLAEEWQKNNSGSDVLGSWTGTPEDKNDKPVQDADDL